MKFIELLNNCSPNLIEGKRIKLMRHQFNDDRAELRNNKPTAFSDEEIRDYNLIINTLSSEAKLSAIRADSKLAEISCAEQGRDVLRDIQIVFAFAASKGTTAEFIGAFKISTEQSDLVNFQKKYSSYLSDLPDELIKEWQFQKFVTKLGYSKRPHKNSYYYNLELLDDPINEYKNRIIIDWGRGINWVQNNLGKEIIQIRANGFVRDFTDYYDFVLSFDELKAIQDYLRVHSKWL